MSDEHFVECKLYHRDYSDSHEVLIPLGPPLEIVLQPDGTFEVIRWALPNTEMRHD
jgi:hypothetical protein